MLVQILLAWSLFLLSAMFVGVVILALLGFLGYLVNRLQRRFDGNS